MPANAETMTQDNQRVPTRGSLRGPLTVIAEETKSEKVKKTRTKKAKGSRGKGKKVTFAVDGSVLDKGEHSTSSTADLGDSYDSLQSNTSTHSAGSYASCGSRSSVRSVVSEGGTRRYKRYAKAPKTSRQIESLWLSHSDAPLSPAKSTPGSSPAQKPRGKRRVVAKRGILPFLFSSNEHRN